MTTFSIPNEPLSQYNQPQETIPLTQAKQLIRADLAQENHGVSGEGLTVAVLDSGLRTSHIDFENRVIRTINFTDIGEKSDVTDQNGHGTNVTGIIAANGNHVGIAPSAYIAVYKVANNEGSVNHTDVSSALRDIINTNKKYHDWTNREYVNVICMSFGDGGNYTNFNISDFGEIEQKISDQIKCLRYKYDVAVIVSSGNSFFEYDSEQGMGFPAIVPYCISVGAVYDDDIGSMEYLTGAIAHSTGSDRVTPFSQRLHTSHGSNTSTTIFAPGAPTTSSGINTDRGESTQQGTSQSAPIIAGTVLLMQQHYMKLNEGRDRVNRLAVSELKYLMQLGAAAIQDGDDEDDNVTNTNLFYDRVDVLRLLEVIGHYVDWQNGVPEDWQNMDYFRRFDDRINDHEEMRDEISRNNPCDDRDDDRRDDRDDDRRDDRDDDRRDDRGDDRRDDRDDDRRDDRDGEYYDSSEDDEIHRDEPDIPPHHR